MIAKTNGGFIVKSKKGKKLSKPSSKKAALRRLREIEYYKHQNK
mgnify:CR=1 FL=1